MEDPSSFAWLPNYRLLKVTVCFDGLEFEFPVIQNFKRDFTVPNPPVPGLNIKALLYFLRMGMGEYPSYYFFLS